VESRRWKANFGSQFLTRRAGNSIVRQLWMISTWFVYMYEMSDFMYITKIILLIILKGKIYGFH
jgi:hypothetical protein